MAKEDKMLIWKDKITQKKELEHQKRTLLQNQAAQDAWDNDPRTEEEIDAENTALDAEIAQLQADITALEGG